MLKTNYEAQDTNSMSWEEFGQILAGLIKQLEDSGIAFDVVSPILRSGGIPAVAIANKLQVINFLPLQLKGGEQVLSLPDILGEVPVAPKILLCDAKTMSGNSAIQASQLLKAKYPQAEIYLATVTRDSGGPQDIIGIKQHFFGQVSDESKKITIFPWETVEYELAEINS